MLATSGFDPGVSLIDHRRVGIDRTLIYDLIINGAIR